jgi:nucleotide-binding universal stress UspA family protein
MGERGGGRRREIVVAVDRDIFPASQTPRAMATRLLDAAVELARGESGTIHLVHAWEIYGREWLDKLREGLGSNEVTDYVDAQRYSHTLWLEELHEQLRALLKIKAQTGLRSTTHLLEGPAAEVIPAWLASNDADVLVMGTLGISGTPGLFIGNTAESLISRVSLPVLAIKPLGFQSPVEV